MRTRDLIRTSQSNLFRSKLRTTLTIIAVFVGAFTISLTNGVGNGVKSYIDRQLGNVGVENAFVVQAKSPQSNPISTDVVKYDPEITTGQFNVALLTQNDINKISYIKDVKKIIPAYTMQISYISAGNDKFVAMASQYVEGFNLDMAAGRVLNVANPNEVTIPIRYVSHLGFSNAEDAIGKNLIVGYKNSQAQMLEKTLTIVGVQQESVLGNSAISVGPDFSRQIQTEQSAGNANLTDVYQGLLVEFDASLTDEEQESLKGLLEANNYTAQTIQDQIGTFSQIISGITAGLNVFGIIALFVATFGIINTLLMAVNERTSEIGLMKALGANSRTVFGIFSLEAASIGFWGALIGILASMGVGAIVNRFAANNFLKDFVGFNLLEFPWFSSLAILIGIVVLSFLAGTLPSLKASRLDPIKALRYE
jgi:putative ABC transport system permease protein